ncbi:hypothetical protein GCM10028857_13360 [Salinarchaeum chitinilyticum]
MKLAFFAEHFDTSEEDLISEPQMESFDFHIFKYGPFSKEVLDELDNLKYSGNIDEDSSRMQHRIKITPDGENKISDIEHRLCPEEQEHLDEIAEEFSDKSGSELENLSLDMLGIEKREKDRYRGMSISSIIDGANPLDSEA